MTVFMSIAVAWPESYEQANATNVVESVEKEELFLLAGGNVNFHLHDGN